MTKIKIFIMKHVLAEGNRLKQLALLANGNVIVAWIDRLIQSPEILKVFVPNAGQYCRETSKSFDIKCEDRISCPKLL